MTRDEAIAALRERGLKVRVRSQAPATLAQRIAGYKGVILNPETGEAARERALVRLDSLLEQQAAVPAE